MAYKKNVEDFLLKKSEEKYFTIVTKMTKTHAKIKNCQKSDLKKKKMGKQIRLS